METVPFCVVFRFIGQHAVPGANRSFGAGVFLRACTLFLEQTVVLWGGRFPTDSAPFLEQTAVLGQAFSDVSCWNR